jgi:hypothetical protein
VCSSDEVEHREKESRSYQGSPEGEHAGQLKRKRGAQQSMLLSFSCRIDDVESSRIVKGSSTKKLLGEKPDERADRCQEKAVRPACFKWPIVSHSS